MKGGDPIYQELAAMDAEFIARESLMMGAYMRGESIDSLLSQWAEQDLQAFNEQSEPAIGGGEAVTGAQLDDVGPREINTGEEQGASGQLPPQGTGNDSTINGAG